MATRKPARRKSARSTATKASTRRRPVKARSLNEVLMDLGRQALIDGVKEVLVGHGVDAGAKINVELTQPKRKAARRRR